MAARNAVRRESVFEVMVYVYMIEDSGSMRNDFSPRVGIHESQSELKFYHRQVRFAVMDGLEKMLASTVPHSVMSVVIQQHGCPTVHGGL